MLAPLHDRTAEMQVLNGVFESASGGSPQLVVVSGHRRVGKTFLLLHAIERINQQRAVFFSATQQSEAVELDRFAQALGSVFVDDPLMAEGLTLGNWERALTAVAAQARRAPVVLVIDEAPYLEGSTPGFASIVQAVWDRLAAQDELCHLTLILTGSAPTVMEQMVGPDGPLKGRTTLHLRLRPFDLRAVHQIWGSEPATTMQAYAACGGWPLHVAAWDTGAPIEVNLARLAGRPGGMLLEDADHILRELPDGPGFGRVLAAVGRGRTSYGDIASEAGQRIEYPLEFLTDSGLVDRETPIGSPRRTRPQYVIGDPYLRFWFTMLYNDRAQIEGGMGDAVLQSRQGQWQRHVGHVFEQEARAHARRLVGEGELAPLTLTGRWWSGGRHPAEIDVLGLTEGRTTMLGEAKWSAGQFDRRWLERLHHLQQVVPDPAQGLQRWVWTRAQPPGDLPADVRVFGPTDMVE